MTKTSKTSARQQQSLTPQLAKLHAAYMCGTGVSVEDVTRAHASDLLEEWRVERAAAKKAEADAERKTWTPEIAEHIATVLAQDESGLFPRATAFTTNPDEAVEGNPTVIVRPASKVEHSGGGLATGKVTFEVRNLATPRTRELEAILTPHSRSKVALGNWPALNARSDGWVLADPYIAHPSAVPIAVQIKEELERMPERVTATGTEMDLGVYVTAQVGETHVLSTDGTRLALRGHLLVESYGTNTMGSSVAYSNNELIEAAKRSIGRISERGGFVAGVGRIESVEFAHSEAVLFDDRPPGVGIAFNITATGRYDA